VVYLLFSVEDCDEEQENDEQQYNNDYYYRNLRRRTHKKLNLPTIPQLK